MDLSRARASVRTDHDSAPDHAEQGLKFFPMPSTLVSRFPEALHCDPVEPPREQFGQ